MTERPPLTAAPRCHRLIGADCAPAAVAEARQRTQHCGNVAIERHLAPQSMPDGRFDLMVFSEVLYFFSDAALDQIAGFVEQRLERNGDCVLVNYLGDTESPRTGEAAADDFIRRLGPGFHIVAAHREEMFRLDILRRAPLENPNE